MDVGGKVNQPQYIEQKLDAATSGIVKNHGNPLQTIEYKQL
jgi:hypothetical protein